MALVVNSNIPSLNAQRNLYNSTSALARSLERLSSGLRINRAGDDAAGLAISESLRSQIRGMNQAVRNANDGISLVATAEGSIAEVSNILQRIRELSIQAASDTNSANNRASMQLEVDQLLEELQRISANIEFNGRHLLDGSFQNRKIQIGTQPDQTVEISIRDMRATILGATAQSTSIGVDTANPLTLGDLIVNSFQVPATADDNVSIFSKSGSAVAVATAINAITADTGVTAVVNENIYTAAGSSIQGITLGTDPGTESTLSINNVLISGVTLQNDDGDGALRNAINAFSNQTGVTASLDSDQHVVLTAEDGRNISVYTTGSAGGALGFTADTGTNLGTGAATPATFGSTVTLISDDPFNIAGANVAFAGLSAGGVAVDVNTAINSVLLTTQEGANNAIRVSDAALRQVNNFRAQLGAITNRLEATVANLRTVAENLSASESRIRDADFASETAVLTKNQILQQAGVAILAQANVTPQAALTLLQG